MRVLGVGHDVVDLQAFDELLAEPGSQMSRAFSQRELRQCRMIALRKHDRESTHLAVRWAGKEAVLKAWCEALQTRPYPYGPDEVPWAGIEILDDARGCPHILLSEAVQRRWVTSMAVDAPDWRISLSHDGPVASAVVLVQS